MKTGLRMSLLAVALLSVTGNSATVVSWKSTTEQNPWVDKSASAIRNWDNV